jgi:hypothetical protein
MIFLVLDAILIYLITKKKESFLLWAFSPIVWYMAPFVSPILPVSFLFLSSYFTLKKYEEKNKFLYLIISAFSLGVACSIWFASIYLTIFFLIAFFYDKRLLIVILYLIPLFAGFSIRLIIDYYYFGLPFLSLITGLGSTIIYILGQQTNLKAAHLIEQTPFYVLYLITLLIISPLLYKLYKLNIKNNKKEIIFLILTSILFLYPPNFQLRYLLTISPFVIILLTQLINKKELIAHVIISLIVIGIATYPYFTDNIDRLTEQDLKSIAKEYPNTSFIAGTSNFNVDSFVFSTLYWNNNIKEFITFDEYDMSKTNNSIFSEYKLESKSKINLLKKMDLIFQYKRTDNKTYNDIKYLISYKNNKLPQPPKEFKLIKEYNVLKLYKKE